MSEDTYGPAMAALNDRQRVFVTVLVQQIGVKPNYTRAARMAGFSDPGNRSAAIRVRAHELAHNPRVLAAIREEMAKRIQLGGMVGVFGLQAIAADPSHKDHLKACIALADRGGYSPEQNINVKHEHTDRTGAALMERIRELAKKHGMDPDKLLAGQAPENVDIPRGTLIEAKANED